MSVSLNPKTIKLNKERSSSIQNSTFSSKLLKLRSRIHKIIDDQFASISQRLQRQQAIQKLLKQNILTQDLLINESKLEDWVEMFKHEILIVKDNRKQIEDKEENYQYERQLEILQFQRPLETNSKGGKQILWTVESNKLNVFQFSSSNLHKSLNSQWQSTTYELPENTIKPFNSITYCSQSNSLIIIGGSKATNPNIKSSKIYQLSLITSQLSQMTNLSYGLSSHTAIYNQLSHQIYIIGGNKNHSIVTRGCFKLKLKQKIVEEISCLNYPAANTNCIMWKDKWVYKFGGIGEAFGGWDVSPYIQRYDILRNEWEVINPIIFHQGNITPNFSNLIHTNSSSYVCQDNNKIFVFGGYSIDGKFQHQAFMLDLNQSQNQNQNEPDEDIASQHNVQHAIREYGTIECDEIASNGFLFCKSQDEQILMYGIKKCCHNEWIEQPYLIHIFSSV